MSGHKARINQFRRTKKPKELETPSPIQVVNHNEDYNEEEYEEQYEDDYEDEDSEPWNSDHDHEPVDYTPIPIEDDNGDDYDANYNEVYDSTAYSPLKKKKYRQSDANPNQLSYADAKKTKNKQIRDNYARRYSKYDSPISALPECDDKVTPAAIDLSMTDPVNNSCSVQEKEKEISVFFNKKTKDKYNEFEMNTYDSSDSNSNSDDTMKKYLNDPLTPAPNVVDSKNGVNIDRGIQLIKPTKDKKKKKEKRKPTKEYIERQKQNEDRQKKKENKEKENKKKKFTLKQFMRVDLEKFVRRFDGDNFDVAKAVCKHYDNLTQDTDTVTIVSDTGMGPNTAYWSKGDYNRVTKDCLGKYIMVYRACKHVPSNVKVKQDVFESCVKGLCMDNLGHSQLIADKLDSVFGEGCHVSLGSHDQFEVFCRYSDGYICEVELDSNDFVVAWRR